MTHPVTFRSGLGLLPVLRLLAAGCFFAFVVGQSPHLVHHLFEPAPSQTDCAFASVGERTQGVPADIVTLVSAQQIGASEFVTDHPVLPGCTSAAFEARAPPLFLS